MAEEQLRVSLSSDLSVAAIRTLPEKSSSGAVFVYAPGAGANVHDPFGTYACRRVAEHGCSAIRFQFPYMEAKKCRPDPTAVLEATWRAVLESVGRDANTVIAGGRSMGGRICSQRQPPIELAFRVPLP